MKNIVLGIVGIFICLYTLIIGLDIYALEIHKNKLEDATSRIVETALENEFLTENESKVSKQLKSEIPQSITLDNNQKKNISVEIQMMDLKKGILSVKVEQKIKLLNGNEKTIVCEKTAIMEQGLMREPKVTVTFLVDEEIYKEYSLVKGQVCPTPKVPSNVFAGWIEYGKDNLEPIKKIGKVTEDKVYVAVTK